MIIAYTSTEEREQIIQERTLAGFWLVEEKNITEGNFLVFKNADSPPPEPSEIEILKQEIASLWYEMMMGGL